MNAQFWRNKRVLITGHTGFKGSWLSLWLQRLGAHVFGYALPPLESASLFDLAAVSAGMHSVYADIRDASNLEQHFAIFSPDIVFHLAAQSLVQRSYAIPAETYEVNVMGTVRLLDTVRRNRCCRVVINVTSDKCYENKEWPWGYRECDPLGGRDPYSSSKGCAELISAAYRHSYFESDRNPDSVAVASARAGNVIGGGDFSQDRIVPDFMAAAGGGKPLCVRNPSAVRPWQHVLEPLSGYLLLAERLWECPGEFVGGWNFGPPAEDIRPVRWIVEKMNEYWGSPVTWEVETSDKPHEAHILLLDSAKARMMLDWRPRWNLEQALRAVVDWHRAHNKGEPVRELVMQQIASYESSTVPASDQRIFVRPDDTRQVKHER